MILCLFKCKHKSISQNSYSRVGTCVCILCWTEQWKCCTKLTQLLLIRFFTAKQSTSHPPSSYWHVRRGRRGDLCLSLCFHSIVFRASGRLIQERNRTEEGYQHVSCLLSVFKASSDSNKKPVFSSCGSPCWPRRRRNALTSHLLWAHRKRTRGGHWSRVLWGHQEPCRNGCQALAVHVPLSQVHDAWSHWTSLTRHKFKEKIIKNFETVTAEP